MKVERACEAKKLCKGGGALSVCSFCMVSVHVAVCLSVLCCPLLSTLLPSLPARACVSAALAVHGRRTESDENEMGRRRDERERKPDQSRNVSQSAGCTSRSSARIIIIIPPFPPLLAIQRRRITIERRSRKKVASSMVH